MKLINPFDRLKKRNNVPLSLFPANKKTATTMPIGRAVPLYCIDMIQGNRLKISCEQLTRFMEMNGPLMQNFEITYNAYFVPYVALDHFFDSAWFSKTIKNESQHYLSARDFFNPATPDSLRVPCQMLPISSLPFGNGSLWQHLGYPTLPLVVDGDYALTKSSGELVEISAGSFYDLCTSDHFDATNIRIKPSFLTDVSSANYIDIPYNFIDFAYSKSMLGGTLGSASVTPDFKSSFAYYAYSVGNAASLTWQQMFGNLTLVSLQSAYIDYINTVIQTSVQGGAWVDYIPTYFQTDVNLYRWLAYLRIYSDWYLNPVYTAPEDFRDVVGCGYLNLLSGKSLSESFAQSQNAKTTVDPTLSFFSDYIAKGECLPVLWRKDQFTSIVQTDAASSVAIGQTIGENFYNRMYAKFKDLVARMGRDYRQNTKALYGSAVGDNSLQRSQVIGRKNFTVQVGEIAQTSNSTLDSNLGQFVGYAMSRDKAGLFDWTAEENGMVMIIAYIRPTFVAIGGETDKSLFKKDYLDYLIPDFGGVGYQPVKANRFNIEAGDSVIGLEERYKEYMSLPSEVSGDMLDVYSYLTVDRIRPDVFQYGTPDFYKNLYMWDTEQLHRVFQNTLYDPAAVVAYFIGNVTRQLPATIRTDF